MRAFLFMMVSDLSTEQQCVDHRAAANETAAWNRLNTVGRTPGKVSPTGQAVIARMRAEGSVIDDPVLGQMFKGSDGEWYQMKLADMSHKTGVITWWNSTGRSFGAKSPEVRSWMLDQKNYVLDYYSINRSQGALLGNSGVCYLPPLK